MMLWLAQSGLPSAETPAGNETPTTSPPAEAFDVMNFEHWEAFFWTNVPSVLASMVIIVVCIIAASVLGRVVYKSLHRARVEETMALFIGRGVKWAVLVLGLVLCMAEFGVDTTSIAALIVGIGFAIAMGFQNTLGSLAAGVLLMVFRYYKVGDTVKLDGELAKVTEIELFTTLLDTFDNRRIILPNGKIFGNKIENLTFHPKRRVDVNVGVSYDADIDKTREVLREAALEVEGRLDEPEFAVVLLDLGDSSVNWVVRVWVNTPDLWTVKDRLTRLVKIKLDEAGLEIPYPQMDVHVNRKR